MTETTPQHDDTVKDSKCNGECHDMMMQVRDLERRINIGDHSLRILPQLLSEVKKLSREINDIKGSMVETKEIVTAWGNIKGFGRTMRTVSAILKTTAIITTATSAIYLMFTHHGKVTAEVAEKIIGN